jgi:hypothetical protein
LNELRRQSFVGVEMKRPIIARGDVINGPIALPAGATEGVENNGDATFARGRFLVLGTRIAAMSARMRTFFRQAPAFAGWAGDSSAAGRDTPSRLKP